MPRRLTLSLALVFVTAPALAAVWSQKAEISATVHGHEFHHVAVEGNDCTLRYKLYFSAPSGEAYASRAQNRNYYVFRARIKLHGDKTVLAPLFGNAAPGERVYDRTYDTTGEGCWAKKEQKLLGVDVEACRARGCTPKAFK